MPFAKVPFGDPKAFNVIVEVPAGGQKKYEYDVELDAIKLDKVLYGELRFPFNYGHVAKTVADDGAPLDAFVFSTYPITTGTVVECRAIGMLEVVDRGRSDHKILAVPLHEEKYEHLQDVGDIPEADMEQLKAFYKELPVAWSRDITLTGIQDKSAAVKELLRTLEFGK